MRTPTSDFGRPTNASTHPQILIYEARCLRKLGRLDEVEALYVQVLAEPLAKNAPTQFVEAHHNAEVELAEVREQRKQAMLDAAATAAKVERTRRRPLHVGRFGQPSCPSAQEQWAWVLARSPARCRCRRSTT